MSDCCPLYCENCRKILAWGERSRRHRKIEHINIGSDDSEAGVLYCEDYSEEIPDLEECDDYDEMPQL